MGLGPKPALPLGASMPIVRRCRGCGRPLKDFVVPHSESTCAGTHAEAAWSGPVPAKRRGWCGSEEP
jgi:hypothetical protein